MKIIRITLLLVILMETCAFGADKTPAPVPVIEDGFFIVGHAGLIKKEIQIDEWNFIPDEAIVFNDKITFPAGQALPLLPCSVLEQMTGLAGNEDQLRVELSALFTEYKHKNYLFSVYFLPILDSTAQPEPEATEEKPVKEAPEESIIPSDILKQIKSTQSPDLKKFMQIAEVTGDRNLIGRAGYLSENKRLHTFQPDAFGMNVNEKQFILLPNNTLAVTEKQMGSIPGKQRYNVSGLVTTYKGQTYMLLRRTTRTYTNGNFTP